MPRAARHEKPIAKPKTAWKTLASLNESTIESEAGLQGGGYLVHHRKTLN
jgi:hypothetical protein